LSAEAFIEKRSGAQFALVDTHEQGPAPAEVDLLQEGLRIAGDGTQRRSVDRAAQLLDSRMDAVISESPVWPRASCRPSSRTADRSR
jgi:hypothetical protein